MNVDKGSSPVAPPAAKPSAIAPMTLFQALESGHRMLLLDVREPTEIERAGRSIPGSIAIPVHQLFLRRNELPPTNTPVIAISAVEERARAAAYTLAILGYTNVRILEGGIEAWATHGLPLV